MSLSKIININIGCAVIGLLCVTTTFAATPTKKPAIEPSKITVQQPTVPVKPVSPAANFAPPQPALDASGYILVDANSGQVLAESNADQKLFPASLTKLMTMYVISGALANGQIHLDDSVTISPDAWKTGGSRMFVQVGTSVPVRDLVQGIIVDSGNDACVAMAEHVAGTEPAFAALMNQQAQQLGMTNTHYVDSTGLPNPQHYSTARDLAKLAVAIIKNYPNDYAWYKQKWFEYNKIRQPNRNRLLWEDPSVDGLKTGHTDEAGFCLVASAQRHDMRLVSVLLGAPSDHARATSSQQLLNYGYAFFETHKIYAANQQLRTPRVWKGVEKTVSLGVDKDIYLTIPKGKMAQVSVKMSVQPNLEAPIQKDHQYGELQVSVGGKPYAEYPLIALNDDQRGGWWRVVNDAVAKSWGRMFHHSQQV